MNPARSALTAEQLALVDALPAQGPVVMLNLLRFREVAAYDAAAAACSGREAYRRYAQEAMRSVTAVGGQVLFAGRAHPPLIAPAGETWDEVFLVRYPSARAFRDMMSRPEYLACIHHRSAALADSRLVPMSEASAS